MSHLVKNFSFWLISNVWYLGWDVDHLCHLRANATMVVMFFKRFIEPMIFFQLAYFCDSDANSELETHNQMAPNQQNIMCAGRSIWDVSNKVLSNRIKNCFMNIHVYQ